MSFLEKITSKFSDKLWKRLAIQLTQILVMFLPIAQLTDIDFVVQELGKFGIKGLVASIIAGYIVAWIKRSPLTKKELEVLEQKETPKEESEDE